MSSSGAVQAGSGLPGYAVSNGARNNYDPLRTLYNAKAGKLARFRAALANAQAGLGFVDIAVVADSLALFNGTVYAQGWPAALRAQLATMFGLTQRPGLIPGFGMQDLNTYAGGMGTGGATYPFSVGAGATWTCVLPLAAPNISVVSPKTNPAASNWTIDAVAQGAIPFPGGAGDQLTAGAVQTDAVHTVVVTTPAGGGAYHGVYATGGATGIRVHNVALTGTDASFGGATKNWSDLTAGGLLAVRLAMLAAVPVVPHLWIYCMGTNDLIDGNTPAQVIAGARTTIGQLPGAPGTAGQTSDLILMPPWSGAGVAVATQQSMAGQFYALADSLDVPAFDWYDQVQGQAGGFANGMIGADGLHASALGNKITGIRLAQALAA